MSGVSVQRIREVFERALEHDGAARDEFVCEACGEDAALREHVRRMLAAHERGSEFLDDSRKREKMFRRAVAGRPEEDPDDLIGVTIGGYLIARLIGVGGMGAVYEAEQSMPHRRVALKVLRAFVSQEVRKRFRVESEVLARLRHPNIAHVYEAGTHQSALGAVPFFAMEFVEGARSLTEYAWGRQSSTRERIGLFLKVCEAVQHAHQRGVIHRDLKPSNILVSENGEPKVIDFGVARLDDAGITAAATLHTSAGQIIGTLQYMSPEQCMSDPSRVDVRSDVYSLGVVLFELLSGQMPYEMSSTSSTWQIPRIICENMPRRLSAIASNLRGDLEVIVQKTLAKEPERRYQTVESLASDLQRFLNGEPIEAKRDHALYVLRKSLQRYRVGIGVTAGFLVLVTASAITFGVLYSQAEEARIETAAKNAELRQENYFALISLANDALERNAVTEARQTLEKCEEDLRDWEWRFLWKSLNDASVSLRLPGELITHDLSPDRSTILATSTFSDAPWAALVNVSTNDIVWRWDLPEGNPVFARWSPDGRHFAVHHVNHQKEMVQVFDAATRTLVQTIEDWGGGVFTPDGRRIVLNLFDGRISVWDLETRAKLLETRGPGGVHSRRLNHDGRLLAIGTNGSTLAGGTVGVIDLQTGQTLWQTTGAHHDHVRSVVFSHDDTLLYSTSAGRACVWNVEKGEVISVMLMPEYQFGEIDVSPDGRTVAVPMTTGLGVFERETGYAIRTLHGHEGPLLVKYLDAETLASLNYGGGGDFRIWELSRVTATHVARGHEQWLICQIYSPDGRWLASVGEEGNLDLREAESAKVVRSAKVVARGRGCLQFSPDSARLAHARVGGPVSLFEVPSMRLIREIGLHNVPVFSDSSIAVRWDGGGQYLFAGTGDQILVFDVETGVEADRVRTPHTGATATIQSIALSRDGSVLASMDNAGQLGLWTVEHVSGKSGGAIQPRVRATPRQFWQGHERITGAWGGLYGLEFSPDGSLLASGNHDQMVRLWDVETGRAVHVLRGNSSYIFDVAFLPEGRRLISSCVRHAVLWDVASGRMVLKLADACLQIAVNPVTEAVVSKDSSNSKNFRLLTPVPPANLEDDAAQVQ